MCNTTGRVPQLYLIQHHVGGPCKRGVAKEAAQQDTCKTEPGAKPQLDTCKARNVKR